MADPGSLLLQGAQNFGSGIEQYRQIQAADAAASGQINAFLAQGPQAVSMLSPDGQSLIEKQMSGKANYKDRLQLMGEISTSMSLRQQQQELAIKNIQLQKWNYIQNMMARAANQPAQTPDIGNTPMSAPTPPPEGSGPLLQGAQNGQGPNDVVKNYIQPPKPVSITDPQIQGMLTQIMPLTGFDMEKASDIMQKRVDAINTQRTAAYNAVAEAKKPTGNLYFNSVEYKDGVPITDVYTPELVKGRGTASESVEEGPQQIKVPHGAQAPGPVIFRGSNNQDNTTAAVGYNTKDPQWQKEVQDAYLNASQSAVAASESKLLIQAADAYASQNTNRLNAIFGDPHFARFRQIFTGNNPLDALRTAMATNTTSLLAQIRSGNGTVGGRILQTEYENLANMIAEGKMTNEAIIQAAANLNSLNQRRLAIDKAYASFREIMPSGDAQAKAFKMFGEGPDLKTVTPSSGNNGMVRVKMPNGQTGSVPAANLEKALAAGATKL